MALSLALVADFVLIMARTMAWLYAAPVFSDRGFSTFARTTTALGLSVFLVTVISPTTLSTTPVGAAATATLGGFALLAAGQIAVGLVMGWVASTLLAAFESAGSLIDLNSGFALSALFDPQSGNQVAVFSRFTRLLFVTLLFATGAFRQLVSGFILSFQAVPLDKMPQFSFDIPLVVDLLSTMLLASLQIAAPVLGALFLTEVTLAIAQRFAPTANVFILGLPAKTLITLLVLGSSLMFYPLFLNRLVTLSLQASSTLLGG
ncbi:flagellar biosynthetic protein FliR [Mycolicibacterium sp.]|jgi:flagellar biosynthesis protein FliR|uniref:flagellar biosynthetic protein FliR n=1 Tax=Mycolicibacterium sp. TaxID=2320850 RepID=UPI0025F3E78A|nr:flagellar biosynthetic protein FliR [Mycolicibacterium sp.]